MSACRSGNAFKRAKYTLNYVYLHIETAQGVDNSKYETAIRVAMSNIFAAVANADTDLGVYEVVPTGFSIAEKLIEVGGRTYLGGQVEGAAAHCDPLLKVLVPSDMGLLAPAAATGPDSRSSP